MGVQLRKVRPGLGNRVIHKDFYERGRYVAHNRDVGILPRIRSKTVLYCTETTTKLCCKSDQRTSVASSGGSSYLLYDNDD